MTELHGAASRTAREPDPPAVCEAVESSANRLLVVRDDRIAVRRLVAREAKRIQREGIDVRCRPLLLDQAAENAKLDLVGIHAGRLRGLQPTGDRAVQWADRPICQSNW